MRTPTHPSVTAALAAAALTAALAAACRPTTRSEDVRVDGRPVSEWIVISTQADNPRAQRTAWGALRHAGAPAVPALRRAMEHSADPTLRSRIGLAFNFLCPSALPAIREEARTAQGDVQTQLQMAGDLLASQRPGVPGADTGVGHC